MADGYLNNSGLSYFWGKVKALVNTALTGKQDTLVSGTNIKTINNQSLLGSGNVDIQGGDNIFYVVYGETSYAEIMQAFEGKKNFVLLDSGISGTGLPFFCSVLYARQMSYFYFVSWYMNSISKSWKVDNNDNWMRFGDTRLQTELVSGASIKTVNNQSLLGSGDIEINEATATTAGTIKLNPDQSIGLNSNGQLEVGGRLGQFSDGGVFYPTTIEPTNVGSSSFLMTDGAKGVSVGPRTFGIMAGANLNCRSAVAGSTQYRLINSQGNRFVCFAAKGGRVAIDQTDAMTNGTALITDISFANGNPISAYFGPSETNNDIIITVDRTVNPDAATTKLRVYGTSTSSDVINVGQGCGAGGGKAISLGQSCFAGGNQCIAFGNSSLALANNSVAFGHTHLVNKQFCFAAGQGHDFTNASNGAGAIGICSDLSSDTLFAVGNGTFATNGNITKSNAFEVTSDGSIVLKSSGGNRFKVSVDDAGNLTTSAL